MNKLLVFLLLLGLILRLVISVQIYSGDVNNHIAWGKDILKLGPRGVYGREFAIRYGTLPPTYPPIPLVVFTLSQAAYDWSYRTSWDLNLRFKIFPSNLIHFLEDQDSLPAFFKIWAILADIGIAWLVYKFAPSFKLLAASLVLFNPAFFYNSAYWGQIDSIPIFFLLASFYALLWPKRPILSAILFILALLTKQSSIILIPLYSLAFVSRFSLKTVTFSIIASLLVFWLSFIPFYQSGNLISFPFTTYLNKIQTGSGSDYVTDHAFNFWALITGLGKISDVIPFWGGIPYVWWGYLFFAILLLGTLFIKPIFAASLTPLAAFLFLTKMHERYLLPSLAFLLLACTFRPKLFPAFIFLSLFYFLNLYHNWWAPRIPWLVNFISQTSVINTSIIISIGILFTLYMQFLRYERN